MSTMQAPNAQPNIDQIRDWLENLQDIPGENELLPKYCHADDLGWTPKFPEGNDWGPAPYAVSRTSESKYALILFGDETHFRRINQSSRVEDRICSGRRDGANEDEEFHCTTVTFENENAFLQKLVIILHSLIISNRDNASISPDMVCSIVLPWLDSGEIEIGDLLSENEQLGLFGELYLLKLLLQLAESENHSKIISNWQGPNAKKRDFADTNQDDETHTVAIECKATVVDSRKHQINGISQLNTNREGSEDLELYIFSMSINQENEGTHKLIDLAKEIRDEILNPDVVEAFIEKLSQVRFSFSHERSYSRLDGYAIGEHFPTALIKIDENVHCLVKEVIIEENWINKKWSNVSYTLDLSGLENTIPVGDIDNMSEECREILNKIVE